MPWWVCRQRPRGFAFTRAYEPHRDLIASVSNSWNGAPVGGFAYANDPLARRVSRLDTASSSMAASRSRRGG